MPSGVYIRTKEHRKRLSESHRGIHPITEIKKGQCAEKNPAWKGGIFVSEGYVYVHQPDHPRAKKDGCVKRCYPIYESVYGKLPKEFELHHTNGNKKDDRMENLSAMTHDYHSHVERVLQDLDFVVVAGVYPKLEDTWDYIDSIKKLR